MDFGDFNIEIRDLGVREKSDGLRWDHEFGGTVACVPAYDAERLYFGCDNNKFYAVDIESGREMWYYETGGCMGNATSVIDGNRIHVGSYDGFMYCLDKETGKLIWRFKTGGKVVSGPAITEDRIIFGSKDGYVYCLDREGNELWRFRTGDEIMSTPTIKENYVYIGSYDCNLYCINIENGKELWRFRTGGAIANLPPVNVHGDYIFFGSWDFSVYCVERHTGKEAWQTQLGGGMIQGGLVYEGVLYIGVRQNNVFYALDIKDGHILWEIKTEANLHASNVEVYDNKIYFGGGMDNYGPGIVYCFSMKGEVIWTFRTDGPTWVGPSVYDGKIFITSWNCKVYRLDPETGKEIWTFRTSGAPSNEKVVDKNRFEVQTIIAKEEIDEASNAGAGYVSIPEIQFPSSEYGVKSEYGRTSEYSSGDVTYK